MNEANDFHDAEVGDRVWSSVHGWGEVVGIGNVELMPSIKVRFKLCTACWFTLDGRSNVTQNRTLFWDEILMVPPPKPKKKVKVRQWVICDNGNYRVTSNKYAGYEHFHSNSNHSGLRLVTPILETEEEIEL